MRTNLQALQIFAVHVLSTGVTGLLPLVSIEEEEGVNAQQSEHIRKGF